MTTRTGIIIGGLLVILLVIVGLVGVSMVSKNTSKNPQVLADGSTLLLKQVVLATNGYNYNHNSRGRLGQLLEPILPDFILRRFPMAGGGFGFGVENATNLILITVHQNPSTSTYASLGRLRVGSDATNVYDACWGAHTLGMQNEIVNGWQVRAFPRRSKNLMLEFLAQNTNGNWIPVASFDVPNALWKDYPQWQPEPFPVAKTKGNLAVTLAEFRSGERMKAGSDEASTAARKTHLLFTFQEDGRPTENWRLQKVTLSDATGNGWFPYLDLTKQEFNWAKGGQAEFLGALWPGENAWKLDVEVVRSGGFLTNDIFKVNILLPSPGAVLHLTNEWPHESVTLKLNALASPDTDHVGNYKWVGKWWGEDKNKVYSLVLHVEPDLNGQRLSLIKAIDDTGAPVDLLEHRSQDYKQQALFLKPGPDASTLQLTFALSHSRLLQFLARPEFIADRQ